MEEERNEVMAERKKQYKLCGSAAKVQFTQRQKSNQLLQQIVADVFMAATVYIEATWRLHYSDDRLERCMVVTKDFYSFTCAISNQHYSDVQK